MSSTVVVTDAGPAPVASHEGAMIRCDRCQVELSTQTLSTQTLNPAMSYDTTQTEWVQTRPMVVDIDSRSWCVPCFMGGSDGRV